MELYLTVDSGDGQSIVRRKNLAHHTQLTEVHWDAQDIIVLT